MSLCTVNSLCRLLRAMVRDGHEDRLESLERWAAASEGFQTVLEAHSAPAPAAVAAPAAAAAAAADSAANGSCC
jgi:dsDNA-binding SOS-regulon protein